jgi:peptidoglycan/xylan/chitin deacetylase (PgdA/CDA1 family)
VLLAAVTTQLGALPAGASTARAAAAAVNQAATSAVSLAAHPSGFDYAFYRGEDDGVYYRTFQNGVWSEQAGIGGRVVGAPGAALAGPGTLVVVGRGTDSALWTRIYSAGAWGPWQSLGGVLSAAPAVVGTGDGRIDVFVRTADNQLASRTRLPGGGWSGWVYLGGGLASGPAAVAFASGRVDVFVTGTNYGVWRRSLGAGAWSAWSTIGGRTYTAPAVTAVPGSFAPRVFVRGTTNALYLNQNTTGTWTGWQNLGGVLIDAPAAAATASGGLDVVVRGGDNALWARMLRGGAWSGFARAWAPAAPPPPAGSLLGTDWTRIPTSAKVVALTFDAGGNTAGLASIRATLQRRNVPATFYLTGAWVRSFPAQANEVAVAGFTTGNHSDTHPHFPALTDAQVQSQVLTAERTILQATGADPRPLFRFPFGDVNDRVLADVNALNYVAVRWTVDSLGWQGTSGGQTTQRVIDRVLAAAQPGEIVLMHVGSNPDDGTTLDAAALPAIIDGLRARGYSFVTLKALTG